ncbi:YjeF-related protein N-terminus-domain-containing protein [Lophiotrema nucula]|uniref:Enhancer of mRNA-decapping protein 3 n=1 Tax=Lophiotrema nucula TaxID=690887 RepID=A0A6A5ZUE9_9PLEO|nr:YjeF-related protein N-terminus-domain-containing protein [Lophiotrema nucula]
MAEPPSGGVASIKARIASLNIEQVHTVRPGDRPNYVYERADDQRNAGTNGVNGVVGKRKPPPPVPGQRPTRQPSAPATLGPSPVVGNEPAGPPIVKQPPSLPPRLPPRRPTGLGISNAEEENVPPPSLPPRKSSEQSIRRQASNDSISTVASGRSGRSIGSTMTTRSAGGTVYRVRAPEYDPSKLPPLPPKVKNEDEGKSATLKAMRSKTDVVPSRTLPPQLPSRPALPTRSTTAANGNALSRERTSTSSTPSVAAALTKSRKSALDFGLNKSAESPPLPSLRPQSTTPTPAPAPGVGAPPPIPLASRPDLSAIMASKPKPGASGFCLKCRDFSGPDKHAERYPRQNLPNSDVGSLAHQLCSPFPSLTDKARAIFTWLHHNVNYDVEAFFSGNLKPSTPSGTITSGLAVCEGYAGLFCALALKAGLECTVVSGHGLGYGLEPAKPGEKVPSKSMNHAWNAVRIDHGEWKLIDPCWGAGHIQGAGQPYVRSFTPGWFAMDNNEFALKHFPSDGVSWFLNDGRSSIPWEEYITMGGLGPSLMVYGRAGPDDGLNERSFTPRDKSIRLSDPSSPTIRFSFSAICPHWVNERHGKGKPYCMLLQIGGRDGRNQQYIPFNQSADLRSWWIDVERRELGAPGMKVNVLAVTEVSGGDARGLTGREWTRDVNNKKAQMFGGVAMWELVHMATGLIGIPIIVTLRNPPNTVVQGLVAAVNPQTATLTLQDVTFPATGHRFGSYNVEGSEIADLKVNGPPSGGAGGGSQDSTIVGESQVQMQTPVQTPQQVHAGAMRAQTAHLQQQRQEARMMPQNAGYPNYGGNPQPASPLTRQAPAPFVDPAILSMGKKTTPAQTQPTASIPLEAPATPIKPLQAAAAAAMPKNTSPFVGVAKSKERTVRKPSAATLEGPFSSLDIADAEGQDVDSDDIPVPPEQAARRSSINRTRTGKPMEDPKPAQQDGEFKKTRRGGKARRKEVQAQERRNNDPLNSSPEVPRKGKGSGWRQTPLLESNQPAQRTPGLISGTVGIAAANASNRKNKRQRALEAKNGWATEDATDIQELPEFDFAENLGKFDKRSVFEQIRNEDTTADEDRLVSFNRLARPGTYGGKNLHPTENVLGGRVKSNEDDDTTQEEENSGFGSGRNSRRAMSRASIKRIPTRQGSGVQPDVDSQSLSGAPHNLISRANRSHLNRQYASSSHAAGSPKLGRITTPPESPSLFEPQRPKMCLRVTSSNKKCPTITPGGMLAVEESAEIDFALSEDIMAESSGRGIAQVALSAINPGGRRLARENINAKPVIVVLAGNHRGGARAIAAARHLIGRGVKVMVALLGYERNADWDRDVRRQLSLFQNFGGKVQNWPDTEDDLKRLQAPPELIIDALLGRNKEFDSLGDEDRRLVLGIVGWANKSRAAVLAVEAPSGVNNSTGEVAILEGEPLEVRAKYIVCLGAPRTGLLRNLVRNKEDERSEDWLIWVVDIGINRAWKSAGISGAGGAGTGLKFGAEWVVQVRFEEE